jgi:hypothetical protein
MAKLGDTLTTRDAVRSATLDDIVGRAQVAAVAIEGGALDGIEVVSLDTLRQLALDAAAVKLPPVSEHFAEVTTPGSVTVHALCPECKEPAKIVVLLNARLTVEDGVMKLAVKGKSKDLTHLHGQMPLTEAPGQTTVDEAVGSIDDLCIRILRAVADVSDAHANEIDPGPPSSLDAIAAHLELATEGDRSDLEDSLYGYANLEEPLVEIVSTKGSPPTYVLTEAGLDMVAAADANTAGVDFGEGALGDDIDDEQDDTA